MAMKSKELQNLLHLESAVIQTVQYAQSTLEEMSRDSEINTQKIKTDTQMFMKSVQHINDKLLQTISYLGEVSTAVPHGGSVYNSEKDFQLAHEQCRLVLDRLDKLCENSKPRDFVSDCSNAQNMNMDC
jgi:hypothetical protein